MVDDLVYVCVTCAYACDWRKVRPSSVLFVLELRNERYGIHHPSHFLTRWFVCYGEIRETFSRDYWQPSHKQRMSVELLRDIHWMTLRLWGGDLELSHPISLSYRGSPSQNWRLLWSSFACFNFHFSQNNPNTIHRHDHQVLQSRSIACACCFSCGCSSHIFCGLQYWYVKWDFFRQQTDTTESTSHQKISLCFAINWNTVDTVGWGLNTRPHDAVKQVKKVQKTPASNTSGKHQNNGEMSKTKKSLEENPFLQGVHQYRIWDQTPCHHWWHLTSFTEANRSLWTSWEHNLAGRTILLVCTILRGYWRNSLWDTWESRPCI